MRQNYYIRFRTDTDTARVYFDLYRDAREIRPLYSLVCSATDNTDFHPWAIVDFARLSEKERARLLELSSPFELACACWVECIEYRPDNPDTLFSDWLLWQREKGFGYRMPDRYEVVNATAKMIDFKAKRYNEKLREVLLKSESDADA